MSKLLSAVCSCNKISKNLMGGYIYIIIKTIIKAFALKRLMGNPCWKFIGFRLTTFLYSPAVCRLRIYEFITDIKSVSGRFTYQIWIVMKGTPLWLLFCCNGNIFYWCLIVKNKAWCILVKIRELMIKDKAIDDEVKFTNIEIGTIVCLTPNTSHSVMTSTGYNTKVSSSRITMNHNLTFLSQFNLNSQSFQK